MADIINHVKEILQISVHNQTEELKRYQIQVCNKFLNIKANCQQTFNDILQKWLSRIFSKIIKAINQQQSHNLKKNIEEILIDATTKQQFVLDRLATIEIKLLNQIEKPYIEQSEEKMNKQQFANTISKPFYENRQSSKPIINKNNTLMKGRSLSTGLTPKRSLSKISIFAESKKIVSQPDKFATKTFQRQTNQTMKKRKKRQQNCFTLLQKTMSHASPSNFMMTYMNRQQRDEKEQTIFPSTHQNKSKFSNQKQVFQAPINNLRESSEASYDLNLKQNKYQQNSKTIQYQKLVLNLEEKITHKFDQLINRYSKIQEKIIPKYLTANKTEEKSKIIMPISIPSANNIKITSEMASSIQQIQKCQQAKSIDRVSGKVVKTLNTTLINKGKTVQKIQNDAKISIKSINIDNKIVRNKKQIDKQDESIEIIKLQKQKQKQMKDEILPNKQQNKLTGSSQHIKEEKNLELKSMDSTILKSPKKIIINKQYIQTLILSFEKITGKLLLPISKKLLYSLKSKYEKLCKKYEMVPLALIVGIEVEEMQMQSIQLKELVMKMQKMMKLKCEVDKKQKIKLYINSFLICWLSFNESNEVVVYEEGEVNQDTIKDKINEVIRRLNN